jgi:hypothetical protein
MNDTPRPKLTPWFPGNINPVRPGMYEVGHDPATIPHHNSRHRLTSAPRRLWDGTTWRAGWMNEQMSIFGTHPSHRWRGLAQDPRGKP